MAVTQQELGRRLREARERCRLTQDAVAQHLGVSRPTIVQLEAGNRSISSLELDRLAHLFGRDIREFFSEAFTDQNTFDALFRAQPDVANRSAVLEKLRECIELGRELTNLEQLLGIDRGLSTVATYPFPAPANRWEAIQQGERLAHAERRRLGLGDAPLADLPDLLEMQGIRTGLVDLPDDLSGLTLSDPKIGLFVVANRAHHHLRRRFSFAHEYTHVLADRDRFGLVSRASDRDELIEIRANAFAASFLMPEDGVRHFIANLGKGRPSRAHAEVFDEAESLNVEARAEPGSQTVQLYDVVQLAHHFTVSRPSALYRLRNLRIINKTEFDLLKALDDAGKGKELAKLLGLPEPDPTEIRNELHHRFLGRALEAYRRTQISTGKLKELAQMVGFSQTKLNKILDHSRLRPHPSDHSSYAPLYSPDRLQRH